MAEAQRLANRIQVMDQSRAQLDSAISANRDNAAASRPRLTPKDKRFSLICKLHEPMAMALQDRITRQLGAN